ncbi:MAG: hypothetical protein HZA89_06035 [Verrucomicrobia bacterium]|nr:hypothetical protein [Verrucomicrobiota bacterium]
MRLSGGRLSWYDLIIFGLSIMIVFPDKVLNWIGERTGKAFGWWHIVLLEIIAVGLLIIAMTLLMPIYPKLYWWYPLLCIGVSGVIRMLMWFISEMFGFDDE